MLHFHVLLDKENDTGYHDMINKIVINEIRLETR